MSVAAVNSSQLSTIQSNFQQLRKEFAQLGQDLSSGSLTQAQTDFVTLSQAAATQFGSNSPVAKTLNSVGQALQSGNLSAAQQAFAKLPTGITPPNAISNHMHHYHGHGHTALSQPLDQLGQALQSGNLSAAQQAFAALQQGWQQMSAASTNIPESSTANPTSVSVTA